MSQILIVGREWKFRALVRAELRELGYEALGAETLDEAGKWIAASTEVPAAIVCDLAESDDPGRDLDQLELLARRVPVVLLASRASVPDPEALPKGLSVLYRPLSVADVVREVRARIEAR